MTSMEPCALGESWNGKMVQRRKACGKFSYLSATYLFTNKIFFLFFFVFPSYSRTDWLEFNKSPRRTDRHRTAGRNQSRFLSSQN
jgi:hypothetical protein